MGIKLDIELLIFLIIVAIHLLIFSRSSSPNRVKRLIISFSVIGTSIMMFLVGLLLGLGGKYEFKNLAMILIYAPIYLPILGFSVYLFCNEKNT